MKKFWGSLLLVILGFTACEGPMGPEGPPGKDGAETLWSYKDFIIPNGAWELAGEGDEIGSYYYCTFEVPEITQDIYEYGAILCNYRFIDDTGTDVQASMPYTDYFVEIINGVEYPFAMQISYNVTPTVGRVKGTIEFRLTFSDFYTGEKGPPESCFFRLTLIY